jgi:hypothetical protein
LDVAYSVGDLKEPHEGAGGHGGSHRCDGGCGGPCSRAGCRGVSHMGAGDRDQLVQSCVL